MLLWDYNWERTWFVQQYSLQCLFWLFRGREGRNGRRSLWSLQIAIMQGRRSLLPTEPRGLTIEERMDEKIEVNYWELRPTPEKDLGSIKSLPIPRPRALPHSQCQIFQRTWYFWHSSKNDVRFWISYFFSYVIDKNSNLVHFICIILKISYHFKSSYLY